MIRRFGKPPQSTVRYTRRPGVYVVIEHGNDILLTFQGGEFQEYQLPGGGVDPGEHMIPALHREVMEETGWTIHSIRRLGAFRRFTYMPEYDLWAEKLCTLYRAKAGLRLSDPSEPDHDAVLVPRQSALGLIDNPGDWHFLNRVLNRR